MIGVLDPYNENLCEQALIAYKKAFEKDGLTIAWHFQDSIHLPGKNSFHGLLEHYRMVIVPRPNRLYIPSLQSLIQRRIQAFRYGSHSISFFCVFR
jgi:hypothetical protein